MLALLEGVQVWGSHWDNKDFECNGAHYSERPVDGLEPVDAVLDWLCALECWLNCQHNVEALLMPECMLWTFSLSEEATLHAALAV